MFWYNGVGNSSRHLSLDQDPADVQPGYYYTEQDLIDQAIEQQIQRELETQALYEQSIQHLNNQSNNQPTAGQSFSQSIGQSDNSQPTVNQQIGSSNGVTETTWPPSKLEKQTTDYVYSNDKSINEASNQLPAYDHEIAKEPNNLHLYDYGSPSQYKTDDYRGGSNYKKHDQPNSSNPSDRSNKSNFQAQQSKVEINIDKIEDEKFKEVLNPDTPPESINQLNDWSDEELDRLVDTMSPDFLPGVIRKTILLEQRESAKTLSWQSINKSTKLSKSELHEISQDQSRKSGERSDNHPNQQSINPTTKQLLNNVSGYLHPGSITCIVAGPDAGATNLLDILATRDTDFEGEVSYNQAKPGTNYNRKIGYVSKVDEHIALLTVFETLWFSARLRLNQSVSDKLVRFRVKIVLKLLGLSHVADSLVGNQSVRGISGGEKRRLSFGVEMVAGREVMLGDLITNGLDSASAYSLVRTMRYACKAGHSMMCTIVQPAPELFKLFHQCVVLSKGAVLFFGPVNRVEEHFKQAGFERPLSKSLPQFLEELSSAPEMFYVHRFNKELKLQPDQNNRNSSTQSNDQVVDVSNVSNNQLVYLSHTQPTNNPNHEWNESKRIVRPPVSNRRTDCWNLLVDHYEDSSFKQHVIDMVKHDKKGLNRWDAEQPVATVVGKDHQPSHNAEKQHSDQSNDRLDSNHQSKHDSKAPSENDHGLLNFWYRRYNSSFSLQTYENCRRMGKIFIRNVGLWRNSWLRALVVGFFAGSLFYDLSSTADDIRSRVGLIFFLSLYLGFGGVQLLPVIIEQRSVYYAQNKANFYHGFTYYFSLQLIQLPIVILETLILLTPVWGLSSLSGAPWADRFWFAFLVLLITSLISRAWVMLLLAISPIEAMAQVLLTMTILLFVVLCGFLIPEDRIVDGFYWLHIISYFTYTFRSLVINDVSPLFNSCEVGLPSCPYQSGIEALRAQYSIDGTYDKWLDFARICGVYVAFSLGAATAYSVINWDLPDNPESPVWTARDEPGQAKPVQLNSIHPDGTIMNTQMSATGSNDRPGASKHSHSQPSKSNAVAQSDKKLASTPPRAFDDSIPLPVPPAALRVVRTKKSSSSPALLQKEQDIAERLKKEGKDDENSRDPAEKPEKPELQRAHSHDFGFDVEQKQTESLVTGKKAYIQWRDLDYTVELDNGTSRQLLRKSYGFARPGVMCALMGASGAGKSTLLDVLADKKTVGKVTGEILVNGRPRDETFTRIAGYVEQFDSHNAFSTIREAIEFSGRMRLPKNVSQKELDLKVKNVLQVLGLTHLADQIIGAPGFGGVSPEVRKKVTIGVELIAEPSLLFLDEPTTGLDSAGAYAVMSAVHDLSKHMAVICTVHQPSMELAKMFDDIILMKEGGEVVYFGPMKELVVYFAQNKLGECPEGKNPVDFALDQLKRCNELSKKGEKYREEEKQSRMKKQSSGGVVKRLSKRFSRKDMSNQEKTQKPSSRSLEQPSNDQSAPKHTSQQLEMTQTSNSDRSYNQPKDEYDIEKQAPTADQQKHKQSKDMASQFEDLSPERAANLPKLFLDSPNYQAIKKAMEDGIMPEDEKKSYQPPDMKSSHAGFLTQLTWLSRRFFLNVYRNWFGLAIRFTLILCFVVLMGLIFIQLQYGQIDPPLRLGVVFMVLINCMVTTNAQLPEIFIARPLLHREHSSAMYSHLAYFFSRYIGDFPFVVLECLLYSMIYFFVDVNGYEHNRFYGFFFWVIFALRYTGIALTHFFGSLIRTPDDAATLEMTFFNTQILVTGFLIPGPSIPVWWNWFYRISFIRYAMQVTSYYVFTHQPYSCTMEEMVPAVYPYTGQCQLVDSVSAQLEPYYLPSGAGPFIKKCPIVCGEDLLAQFGVETDAATVAQNFGILHCFAVFFFICAFLSLKYVNHVKR